MQKLFALFLLTFCLSAPAQTAFEYPINGTVYFDTKMLGSGNADLNNNLKFKINKLLRDEEVANRITPFKFDSLRVNDLAFDFIVKDLPPISITPTSKPSISFYKRRREILVKIIQPDGNCVKINLQDTLDFMEVDFIDDGMLSGNSIYDYPSGRSIIRKEDGRKYADAFDELSSYREIFISSDDMLAQKITDRIKTMLLSIPKDPVAAKKMATIKEKMQNTYRNDEERQAAFKENIEYYKRARERIDGQ